MLGQIRWEEGIVALSGRYIIPLGLTGRPPRPGQGTSMALRAAATGFYALPSPGGMGRFQ